jgi:hypothetical protein
MRVILFVLCYIVLHFSYNDVIDFSHAILPVNFLLSIKI